MTAQWHKVEDPVAFLRQRGKRVVGPHSFSKRVCAWAYCSRCGLIALKNDATRREMAKPCVTEE